MTWFAGITSFVVLGQGRYTHMGRRFRQGGADYDSTDFVIMVLVLLAIAAVASIVARYFTLRQERGYSSTRALFSELARAHQLDWTSRRLLRQLAAHHAVPACQLFLEPGLLAAEQLGPFTGYRTEIAALRERLFETNREPTAER